MKKILLLFILLLNFFDFSIAQDILVFKKDESELKCRIGQVNDTLVTYTLWDSPDQKTYSTKRSELLSFLYDEKYRAEEEKKKVEERNKKYIVRGAVLGGAIGGALAGINVANQQQNASRNKNGSAAAGILGRYKSGETVSGYVVTNTNDSIYGRIAIRNAALNQLSVKFITESDSIIEYGLKDLKAYGYNELRFEKISTGYVNEITNNKYSASGEHFLHLEVDGPAKLYRFYTLKFKKSTVYNDPNPPYYFGKTKAHFFIVNPFGKQLLTKGRTIKGCVNRLFADDKQLMEKIRMKGINAAGLPDDVRGYNTRYMNKK